MTATTVAPSSGMEGWDAASIAALMRSMPFCKRTITPSATTIALSTIIPMAMMSAPSDMRCRSSPIRAMARNVTTITMTRPVRPTTRDDRSPMASHRTPITMATAWARLIRNDRIAVETWSDCQEMRSISIPWGRSAISSARRASIVRPTWTMLTPGAFDSATPIEG